MNLIIMLLSSVEKLGKAVRFCGNIFIFTIAPTSTDMHIASVMSVDKLLILFLVLVSAIFN